MWLFPNLALQLEHDNLIPVLRCRIVTVVCLKSISLTLSGRISETQQPAVSGFCKLTSLSISAGVSGSIILSGTFGSLIFANRLSEV